MSATKKSPSRSNSNAAAATHAKRASESELPAEEQQTAKKSKTIDFLHSHRPGFGPITPYLVVPKASEAIKYYKEAFGATQNYVMSSPADPDSIFHAEITVFDTKIMLSDEMPKYGHLSPKSLKGSAVSLVIYVPDVDATCAKAKAVEGTVMENPPSNMFWGSRCGMLKDPFGHQWTFATFREIVPQEEMQKRFDAMCSPANKDKDPHAAPESDKELPKVPFREPGYANLTPYITVKDAGKALEYYTKVFDATLDYKLAMPADMPGTPILAGSLNHVGINVFGAKMMFATECPGRSSSPESLGGSSVSLCIYVNDCDAVVERAVREGAKLERPCEDQFWGDRSGSIVDPFGHKWSIGTFIREVPHEDMMKACAAMFGKAHEGECAGDDKAAKEDEKKEESK